MKGTRLSSWNSSIFEGLTMLNLELSPMQTPPGNFVTALKSMRNMRELRLRLQHSLGHCPDPTAVEESICLPCLKKLTLPMPIGEASRLLKRATSPVLEHITLEVYFHLFHAISSGEEGATSLVSELALSLNSFCASLPFSKLFRSTTIKGSDNPGTHDAIVVESLSDPSDPPASQNERLRLNPLTFELRIGCEEETREEIMDILYAALLLSDISTLALFIKPTSRHVVSLVWNPSPSIPDLRLPSSISQPNAQHKKHLQAWISLLSNACH
ncbi:hypothetical protein BKA70DRAFT_339516 [Coprinopsis sp. MPI-PUGE-AT-0042]|nr:hypothetical protein BKA70DRAFT_339516 [Coprinopsis sp. MPI-PUGE-AT-0042]